MIVPYNYNHVDPKEPVEVYRNLKKKGVWYSIRQHGYVVAHADELCLVNAEFIVQKAGNKRARKGPKNVHAWIRGELASFVIPEKSKFFQVAYDPKKYDSFVRLKTGKPVKEGRLVCVFDKGVFVDNSVNL